MPRRRTLWRAAASAVVLACGAATAHADVVEVGATVGRLTTSMVQTYDCPPREPGGPLCPDRGESHDDRRGFAAALYARYPLARAWLLEAQLVYAQKGYETTQPTIHVDYLELPLLLRVDPLRTTGAARPFVHAGLAAALRVRCTDFGEAVVEQNPPRIAHYEIRCGDDPGFYHPIGNPARFDLGYVFGVGLGWESPLGLIEIEARRTNGLVDNEAWGPDGPTKNRAFSIQLGFGRSVAL